MTNTTINKNTRFSPEAIVLIRTIAELDAKFDNGFNPEHAIRTSNWEIHSIQDELLKDGSESRKWIDRCVELKICRVFSGYVMVEGWGQNRSKIRLTKLGKDIVANNPVSIR